MAEGTQRGWGLVLAQTVSIRNVRGRWLRAGHDEDVLRALSLALLFIGGATLALVSLAFPEAPQVKRSAVALLAVVGYPTGLTVLFVGHRLPGWAIQVLLAGGTILTCAGIYVSHGAGVGASASFFFVWVAMFAFHFFTLRLAVAQLIFAAAGYAVVQLLDGGKGAGAEWVLTVGTASVAGGVMWLVSRRLRNVAATDHLTGLPNRAALDKALGVEVARATREGNPLSLAIMDIDEFKAINDRLGHAAGDEVLVGQARAWADQLRATDVLARYGGDEFVVVVPGTDQEGARQVVDRMLRAGPARASAGLASFVSGDCPESLLQRADHALGRNKAHRHAV